MVSDQETIVVSVLLVVRLADGDEGEVMLFEFERNPCAEDSSPTVEQKIEDRNDTSTATRHHPCDLEFRWYVVGRDAQEKLQQLAATVWILQPVAVEHNLLWLFHGSPEGENSFLLLFPFRFSSLTFLHEKSHVDLFGRLGREGEGSRWHLHQGTIAR